MFIQTEKTPNPATVKFLPGQTIMERGTAEFASFAAAGPSPLAQRLFGLQGVARIFFGKDFVSVSKAEDTDWSVLTPMVLGVLMEHLSTGQPVMTAQAESAAAEEDDEITAQIKILIEERVRPMVMMDGGDIVFDSFQDGVVFLQMRGACSGCPSSTATLKQGIETMLKHYIPEVTEVRPVEG